MIAYLFNHRVEIKGGEIREFDGWGRVTVRGQLKGAVVEESGAGEITIVTDGGSIKVGEGIRKFGELRAIVEGLHPERVPPAS
jgi:hypothetical protein